MLFADVMEVLRSCFVRACVPVLYWNRSEAKQSEFPYQWLGTRRSYVAWSVIRSHYDDDRKSCDDSDDAMWAVGKRV